MTPYLSAFEEYEKHDRGVSWTDALDFHLQRGAVISTPDAFVMARPVDVDWEDDLHVMLRHLSTDEQCWHVWAVAGSLKELLTLAHLHGVRWVTYQRHGQDRLRRVAIAQLSKRCKGLGAASLWA
jgi:hypothetical protein